MPGYILEILLSKGWRRGGEIFWTLDDALREASLLIRRKIARQVRILPVVVDLQAVAELPKSVAEIETAFCCECGKAMTPMFVIARGKHVDTKWHCSQCHDYREPKADQPKSA